MCDGCEDWFHPKCIGMDMDRAKKHGGKKTEIFLCAKCNKSGGSTGTASQAKGKWTFAAGKSECVCSQFHRDKSLIYCDGCDTAFDQRCFGLIDTQVCFA